METDMVNTAHDKRASDRVRSFLRAQIIFNNRMTTIDCIIKNISATGARVALDEMIAVPTEFEIYIPQHRRNHHARLVWRDKESIGIDFLDALQPAAPAASAPAQSGVSSGGSEARLRELEDQNAELKRRIKALNKRLEDLGQDPSNVF